MKPLTSIFSRLCLVGLMLAGVPVLAQDTFNDAFGGAALNANWQAADGALTAPALVTDGGSLPSGDGKVLAIYGNQTLLAGGTEEWREITASVSLLPSTDADCMQGLIFAASKGFSRAATDAYFMVSINREASFTALRLYGNGLDVTGAFPGAALRGVLLPGNPHDGNYHELKVVVDRDNTNPLISIYWDNSLIDALPADPWWSNRAPFGRVGVFATRTNATDESRFDNFLATWDDTPAAVTNPGPIFSDPFDNAALDSHWFTTRQDSGAAAPAVVADAGTLPSGDGEVLQVAGTQVLQVRGSESWTNNTINCYVKPLGGGGTQFQGVIAAVGKGFNFSKFDGYFYAGVLRFGSASTARVGFNGGDSNTAWPGGSLSGSLPGDPLDGNFHKITFKVDRDGTSPIWTMLWDDTPVITFGPDAFWSARAPFGRVGIMTAYNNNATLSLFDQFTAQDDDNVPVELSEFAAQ